MLLGGAWWSACGDAEAPGLTGGPSSGGKGGYPNDDASVVGCVDGQTKPCSVTVSEHNGVLTCYDGVQVCSGGAYGPCQDGATVQRARPQGMTVMSLSDAGDCQNNPCDPTCQTFNEDPDGGLSLEAGTTGPAWVTSTINDLSQANWPKGLFQKGVNEPCFSNMDCQYDQYCFEPNTSAACTASPGGHSKCATGDALPSNCDPCVTAVCAAMPSCCSSSSTLPWSKECVAKVGEVCGSICPTTGTCDHSTCLAGGPLSAACDPCVASICAIDPHCCTGAWDNACVAKVGPVCNETCNAEAGKCRPYNPGQTNPYCVGGPDLTAGVPCGNTVPICNRGSTTVAANTASFFYFPGLSSNDSTFTTCSVSTSLQNTAKQCPIPVAIPPGECRSITCAALGNNGGIVVNPGKMSGYPSYAPIQECSCQNNWSLFKKPQAGDPPCGAPACFSTSVEAKIPTVNMFIMYDHSGSMCEPQSCCGCSNPGPTTRWALTTGALRDFIRDPASAGLRVALRFFAGTFNGYECGGKTCTDDGCKVPEVPLGALLSAQVTDTTCSSMPNKCSNTADPQECELIKAIRCTSPGGWTPLLPALGGATKYMSDYAWTYPTERSVVVLVTDGYPQGDPSYPADCQSPPGSKIIAKAADAYNNYGVVTYTVNVMGGDATLMQNIATAGHGQYFYVTDANASTDLVNALNQIRANSVSCDLLLDTNQGIDPTQVSVVFTSGSGVTSNFTKLASGQPCGTLDDRWYFDNDTTPTKITLCPSTCARVRADINSKLNVVIGCPTSFQPTDYVYQYTGVCGPSQTVQWGHLIWNTTTPGNSSITFKARASNDINTFATPANPADLTTLGIAHANQAPYTGDTQVCTMSGPSPDCPVDLYAKLGKPAANYSNLELTISLAPSTTGSSTPPSIDSWNVTYSCVDSE